jgi:endonuclease YncB( thermonuclease family)
VGLLLGSPLTTAEAYTPFAENLPARLVAVKSASVISVEAQTWPGFTRTFDISLAGIEVPQDTPAAGPCERKLAKQALAFVQDSLANAEVIEIKGMKMENSAQQNAEGDIGTSQGSLSQALVSKGLARPDSIDSAKSWCE